MSEKLWKIATPADVSNKCWRIIEESDTAALDSLFGNCKSFEEMNLVAEELYNDIFEEDASEGI